LNNYALIKNETVIDVICGNNLSDTFIARLKSEKELDRVVIADNTSLVIGSTIKDSEVIPPSLYPSWVWNSIEAKWEAPIPHPADDEKYLWNEAKNSWIKISKNLPNPPNEEQQYRWDTETNSWVLVLTE
jgi:hypothetical protein